MLPILEPCTNGSRYIDPFHPRLFSGKYQVDPLDTRARKNTLTSLCASDGRCRTDRITGKSISFKFFYTCHIESRFEKFMDVSGKPFIVYGIAPRQPQQTTRNEHVSMHTFDLFVDNYRSRLLAGCGQVSIRGRLQRRLIDTISNIAPATKRMPEPDSNPKE